jgi:hypothetical protein
MSAGRIFTRPSSMVSTDGAEQAPRITMASQPVRLAAIAKWEEESASLSRSVNGDLATTANLAEVVRGVPTRGLRQKMIGASGASGSTRVGASRWIKYVANPTPPM